MSTSSTRFIQIANDNSLITYQPDNAFSSVPKTSNTFQIGNMGSPMSPTLRSTQNGTISFTFQGVAVTAVASYIVSPTKSQSGLNVNCRVDDVILGSNIPQSSQNNWPICSSASLPDGEHTLIIDLPDPAGSSVFFDYLLYAPSPSSNEGNLTDVSIRIEETDPSVSYSGGFVIENDAPLTQFTNAKNAFINVTFFGQQLSWYGAFSTFLPALSSTAEYAIDGGSSTQFSLSGPTTDASTGNTAALLNQLLFQTDVLPLGLHQLTATYLGDGQHTALSLTFVIIQNGSSLTSPAAAASSSNAINTPSPTLPSTTNATNSKSHNDQAVIIGVVVGVGTFLLLVAALFFYTRRHRFGALFTNRKNSREMVKKLSVIGEEGSALAVAVAANVPVKTTSPSSEIAQIESSPASLRREQTTRTVQTVRSTTSDSLYASTLIIPPIPQLEAATGTITTTTGEQNQIPGHHPSNSNRDTNLESPARTLTVTFAPASAATETATLSPSESDDRQSYTLVPTPFLLPRQAPSTAAEKFQHSHFVVQAGNDSRMVSSAVDVDDQQDQQDQWQWYDDGPQNLNETTLANNTTALNASTLITERTGILTDSPLVSSNPSVMSQAAQGFGTINAQNVQVDPNSNVELPTSLSDNSNTPIPVPVTHNQPGEMDVHMDSGVRLGRQTLSYASMSSASISSKEKLPPMYSFR